MIKYCKHCAAKNIIHEFQDKNYGKFMRLHNPSSKSGKCRCTICNNLND